MTHVRMKGLMRQATGVLLFVALIVSGSKPAFAMVEAIYLGANIIGFFAQDINNTILMQNREAIRGVHRKLENLSSGMEQILMQNKELSEKIDAVSAKESYKRLLSHAIALEMTYNVRHNQQNTIGDQNERFEKLENSVIHLLNEEDQFYMIYSVLGMILILDTIKMYEHQELSDDDRRNELNKRLELYIPRLEQALDPTEPGSIAEQAYFLNKDLSDKQQSIDFGYVPNSIELLNNLSYSSLTRPIKFMRNAQNRNVEDFLLKAHGTPCGTRNYWVYSGDKNQDFALYNEPFDQIHYFVLYDEIKKSLSEARDELENDMKLLKFYQNMLLELHYSVNLLKFGPWSEKPDQTKLRVPRSMSFINGRVIYRDHLQIFDNMVSRFDRAANKYRLVTGVVRYSEAPWDSAGIEKTVAVHCDMSRQVGQLLTCPMALAISPFALVAEEFHKHRTYWMATKNLRDSGGVPVSFGANNLDKRIRFFEVTIREEKICE